MRLVRLQTRTDRDESESAQRRGYPHESTRERGEGLCCAAALLLPPCFAVRFSNGAAAYHAASKVRADDAVPHAGGRLVVGGRVLLVKLRLDGGGEVLVQLVLAEDLFVAVSMSAAMSSDMSVLRILISSATSAGFAAAAASSSFFGALGAREEE